MCSCLNRTNNPPPAFKSKASTLRVENVTLVPYIWDLAEELTEPSRIVNTQAQTISFAPHVPLRHVLAYGASFFFTADINDAYSDWTNDFKQGAVVAGGMSFRLGLVSKGKFASSFAPWTTTEQDITLQDAKESQGCKTIIWAILLKRCQVAGVPTSTVNKTWDYARTTFSWTSTSNKRPRPVSHVLFCFIN